MSSSMELFVLAAALHLFALLGVGALLLMVFRSDDATMLRPRRADGDDDDGGGGSKPRKLPPGPSIGGPPLPWAIPARIRLREPGRLADLLPRRDRRPAHRPETPHVPARR
jgi:hypothetical protein